MQKESKETHWKAFSIIAIVIVFILVLIATQYNESELVELPETKEDCMQKLEHRVACFKGCNLAYIYNGSVYDRNGFSYRIDCISACETIFNVTFDEKGDIDACYPGPEIIDISIQNE